MASVVRALSFHMRVLPLQLPLVSPLDLPTYSALSFPERAVILLVHAEDTCGWGAHVPVLASPEAGHGAHEGCGASWNK